MARTIFFTIFLSLFASFVSAEEAEIVSVEGRVSVRDHSSSKWQKAEVGKFLAQEAEIQSGSNGKCVIAFGADRQNTLTIEKNSQIKLESIVPGKVYLPLGRVFALIRNLDQGQNFQVRTPTAVSGARGTGWVTEFIDGITSISVFEDNIFVSGFDEDGAIVSEFDVGENFKTFVPAGGQPAELERVSETDKQEWRAEANTMEKLKEEAPGKPMSKTQEAPLGRGPDHYGPMGPKEMQLMIEKMKESGRYSDQEIQEMQKMMEGDFEQMTSDEMFKVMGVMQEMGGMSPEEQAMMQEAMSRRDEVMAMTPDQRESFFHQLEGQYGITPDPSYQGGYEGKNGFDQYMQSFNQGPSAEPYHEYSYEGDHFFGEFDQQWSWQGGQYVQDPYYQYYMEQYITIMDQPLCACPSNCTLSFEACPDFPH